MYRHQTSRSSSSAFYAKATTTTFRNRAVQGSATRATYNQRFGFSTILYNRPCCSHMSLLQLTIISSGLRLGCSFPRSNEPAIHTTSGQTSRRGQQQRINGCYRFEATFEMNASRPQTFSSTFVQVDRCTTATCPCRCVGPLRTPLFRKKSTNPDDLFSQT